MLVEVPSNYLPNVGDIWHWEPMISHASERIKIVEIRKNEDGEYWIGTVRANRLGWFTDVFWNDLGRFYEACVLVDPAEPPEERTTLNHNLARTCSNPQCPDLGHCGNACAMNF